MNATEPTSPPPLLRAAALLNRAAESAKRLSEDLEAALNTLLPEQIAATGMPVRRLLQVADLIQAVRVRLLDARTGSARLPDLALAAENLHAEKLQPTALEGDAS